MGKPAPRPAPRAAPCPAPRPAECPAPCPAGVAWSYMPHPWVKPLDEFDKFRQRELYLAAPEVGSEREVVRPLAHLRQQVLAVKPHLVPALEDEHRVLVVDGQLVPNL